MRIKNAMAKRHGECTAGHVTFLVQAPNTSAIADCKLKRLPGDGSRRGRHSRPKRSANGLMVPRSKAEERIVLAR